VKSQPILVTYRMQHPEETSENINMPKVVAATTLGNEKKCFSIIYSTVISIKQLIFQPFP